MTDSVRIELLNPESVVEQEAAGGATRDTVALTYAFAIRSSDEVDFGRINRAILKRWSPSGLEYIKRKAWRYVEGKDRP